MASESITHELEKVSSKTFSGCRSPGLPDLLLVGKYSESVQGLSF